MKTILIVDDDINFGRELAATLKSLKMNAHFAHTGLDAVRKYQENQYHMIFLSADIVDPDGFKTAHAIRTIERHRGGMQIPIIGLSTNGFKAECIDAGMSDYLHKPLDLELLKNAVKKWKRTINLD
jgi:CheY-like chemotaxis protein